MPVMDGIECLEKIREENIEIPVLAMTAFASKSEKGKHLKMGFNDYITKPLSPEELIIKLKSFSQ
jgi:CheY-like chemotaxis protein